MVMSCTPRRRLSDLTIVLPSSPTFHSSPPYRVLGGGLKRSSEETFLESSCASTSRPGGVCALLKRQRSSSCPFLGADHHVMAAWGQRLFSRGAAASKSTTSVDAFGVDFTAASAPLLWVWDFDLTILRIHSYGSRIRAEVRHTTHVFPAKFSSEPTRSRTSRLNALPPNPIFRRRFSATLVAASGLTACQRAVRSR